MTDWPFPPLVLIASTLANPSSLHIFTLVKDLDYQFCIIIILCYLWLQYFTIWGGVVPREGVTSFNLFN